VAGLTIWAVLVFTCLVLAFGYPAGAWADSPGTPAALVWSGDLRRELQQVLFDTADIISF
jgi:hypothetical protein